MVAVICAAKTGLDVTRTIVSDVFCQTKILRRERVLDGAEQDPGREALSECGRLRGGLSPAVQEAGLPLETGLGVGGVGPVEGLTVLLVRVEERTTGETLETRAGVRLLHLHQALRS